jgi:hemin uptake protein HemP
MEKTLDKVQLYLSDEATAEFEALLENSVVCELAKRYFKELMEFPPAAWGDLHRREGQTLFKSDNHVIFDIQGSVLVDTEGKAYGVRITRFRLRRKA